MGVALSDQRGAHLVCLRSFLNVLLTLSSFDHINA